MIRREGRSFRCDRPRKSAGMAANDVDLTFANNRFAVRRAGNGTLGFVQRIQNVGLLENCGFRRVDVLGRRGGRIQYTRAEGNDPSHVVANRKDQPPVKPIAQNAARSRLLR